MKLMTPHTVPPTILREDCSTSTAIKVKQVDACSGLASRASWHHWSVRKLFISMGSSEHPVILSHPVHGLRMLKLLRIPPTVTISGLQLDPSSFRFS